MLIHKPCTWLVSKCIHQIAIACSEYVWHYVLAIVDIPWHLCLLHNSREKIRRHMMSKVCTMKSTIKISISAECFTFVKPISLPLLNYFYHALFVEITNSMPGAMAGVNGLWLTLSLSLLLALSPHACSFCHQTCLCLKASSLTCSLGWSYPSLSTMSSWMPPTLYS